VDIGVTGPPQTKVRENSCTLRETAICVSATCYVLVVRRIKRASRIAVIRSAQETLLSSRTWSADTSMRVLNLRDGRSRKERATY